MVSQRNSRQIRVGTVKIGGGAPVSIQSMTKTDTRDVSKTVRQIKELEKIGCEIIRVAVLDVEAAGAIKEIKKKINIPLVADIHFHYNLAIEAIKNGADKIRLNPGNIRKKEDVVEVIKLAKKRKVPIRIGVNSGSVSVAGRWSLVAGQYMTKVALDYINLFESLDFNDIIVSLKASDVVTTIDAYRQMASVCDYPFHLGVTAAGPSECGIIKSSVGIGALLAEGIGDTIRVSLTGRPHDEVKVAKEILQSLGLRKFGIDIISCPTCGRCEVDLVKIVDELTKKLSTVNCKLFPPKPYSKLFLADPPLAGTANSQPVRVAIMGCIVNGPGEAKDADIGIAAGKKSGILFRKGKIIKKVHEKDFVKTLLRELNDL